MISNLKLKKRINNKWNILLGLSIVGFVLYWKTFTVGFLSDDFGFVEDAQLRGWNAFSNNFGDKFFIPFSHFLGLLLFKLTSGNAVLMHVIQLFVHVGVSFQLYLFIREIGCRLQKEELFMRVALFTSILFLVHPYQTEAVVWLAAKSYGYSLLFSILSVRWFFKDKIYWSIFFLILAIHTKESGYFIPLTTYLIAWSISFRVAFKYWLSWSGVIVVSLLIRYLVLGEITGGYGLYVHSHFEILKLSIPFYFFKFLTFFKLTVFNNVLPMATFLFSVFIVLVALITKKIQFKNIIWFMLLVGSLLIPVLTLELTSVGVIASDRYSYFALTAMSFGIGYFLALTHQKTQKTLAMCLVCAMCVVTWSYNSVWVGSGCVKDQFLRAIKQNAAIGENILLVNIPDTFQGVYCLRNGIEDYLRTQEIDCNIEIDCRQNFETLDWGCYLDSAATAGLRTIISYPDSTQLGRSFFCNETLNRYDKVFIYRNETLILL